MKQNTRFRHESLQDQESVQQLLNALVEGISKGRIVLEDEDGHLLSVKFNALSGTADFFENVVGFARYD